MISMQSNVPDVTSQQHNPIGTDQVASHSTQTDAPTVQSYHPSNPTLVNDATQTDRTPIAASPYHIRAHEALQVGLILSQQEKQFGTNMYKSLTAEDEPEIERLHALGFSAEEAVLKIFQNRYVLGIMSTPSERKHEATHDSGMTRAHTYPVATIPRRSPHSNVIPRSGVLHPPAPPVALVPPSVASTAVPSVPRPAFARPSPAARMSSVDALHLGLLLSQQEAEYGINMYDSLGPADEEAMHRLMEHGRSSDEAVLKIFTDKVQGGKTASDQLSVSAIARDEREGTSPTANSRPSIPPIYTDWRQDSALSPRSLHWVNALTALDDNTAMHLAYLLTQQERDFGVNMYDAMRTEDQPEVASLVAHGYTSEQAMLRMFERRYMPHHAARRRHVVSPTAASTVRYPAGYPGPTPFNTPSASQIINVDAALAVPYPIQTTTPHHHRARHSHPVEVEAEPTQQDGPHTSPTAETTSNDTARKISPKSSILGFLSTLAHSLANNLGDDDDPYAQLKYSDADVRVLMDMGYKEEQAVTALLQCENNLPKAIDVLCRSEHHPHHHHHQHHHTPHRSGSRSSSDSS